MKILCVCHGGFVRSHTLASVLKLEHGHDALSVGVFHNSPETVRHLCEWADEIWPVNDDEATSYIPQEYSNKVKLFPIGPDIWGTPWHPDLLKKIKGMLA